jgi:dipeptidyl-peptidase-4
VHDDHGTVIAYLTRDQRRMRIDAFDPATRTSRTLRTIEDQHWVDVHGGVPTLDSTGALLTIEPIDGVNRLCRDGVPISAAHGNVVALLDPDDPPTVLTQSHPTTLNVTLILGGDVPPDTVTPWCAGVARHGNQLVACASLESTSSHFIFRTASGEHAITSNAEQPALTPHPNIAHVTERGLPTALLLPEHHDGGSLPVIMSPYGGPHGQRVISAASAYLTEQWIANRGYAVLVVDGAGTPGRGPDNERLVSGDLAGPVLDDQVAALHAIAAQHPELDLHHVGIRGWSFGGYLAALAVLDRPDVFHAAVAGAPVTDWRLYDTAYTERYLGNPAMNDEPYARTDLITRAPHLTRPLLLIHGLADDNVVAAHTLQLSHALLAAGREHQVLPLSGITHMTPQEIVAENLLLLEMSFFDTHLRGL